LVAGGFNARGESSGGWPPHGVSETVTGLFGFETSTKRKPLYDPWIA
jgi:hypothetical protein